MSLCHFSTPLLLSLRKLLLLPHLLSCLGLLSRARAGEAPPAAAPREPQAHRPSWVPAGDTAEPTPPPPRSGESGSARRPISRPSRRVHGGVAAAALRLSFGGSSAEDPWVDGGRPGAPTRGRGRWRGPGRGHVRPRAGRRFLESCSDSLARLRAVPAALRAEETRHEGGPGRRGLRASGTRRGSGLGPPRHPGPGSAPPEAARPLA